MKNGENQLFQIKFSSKTMSEKDLSISGLAVITICYGIVGAFFMSNFTRKNWLRITNAKRKYIDDWLTKLKRDGNDIRANYLPSFEPLPKGKPYKYYPIMIPPTPLSQYVDRMNMKLLNELKKTDEARYGRIKAQRFDSKDGYEAEVIVFRALERLKVSENIFVLHSLKYSQRNYHYFVGEAQQGECDFIIMGRNYYVIIEVKKNQADVKKAMDQAKRTEKLIAGIMAQITDKVVPQILKFAACPFAGKLKDALIITKKDLKDDRSFYSWWEKNVIDKVDQQTSSIYYDDTRDILIALWPTNENNKCEKESCSLEWNVLKIDKELKDGLITFEPRKGIDAGSASLDVVEAPEVIRKYCGVKYLTTEQNEVFQCLGLQKCHVIEHLLRYKTDQEDWVFEFEKEILRYHENHKSEAVLPYTVNLLRGFLRLCTYQVKRLWGSQCDTKDVLFNILDGLFKMLRIYKTEKDKVCECFHRYQTDNEDELLLRYKTEEESSLRDLTRRHSASYSAASLMRDHTLTEVDEFLEFLLRYKTEEDKVFECILRYKTVEDKVFEPLVRYITEEPKRLLGYRPEEKKELDILFELFLKFKTERDLVFERLRKIKTERDFIFERLLKFKPEEDKLFKDTLRSHIPFFVWIDGPAGSGKTVLLTGRLLQLAQLDTARRLRRSVVFKFFEGNSDTDSTKGEEHLTIYQRACQKAGVDVEFISPSNFGQLHSLTDQIINSNTTVIIMELKYVDIEYLKYTFACLHHESFQRNVIIDDFQCLLRWYDKAGICDLLYELNSFYRVSRFSLLIACDLGQWYWYDRKYIDGVRNCIEKLFGKRELTKNLRNTCDVSDVLSVFRDRYIEVALNCDMLPKQISGHFIRGPLTEFHIFKEFDFNLIKQILDQELVKLCRINESDNSEYGTVVYNDVNEALIKSILDVNKEKINVCHCAQINSAEWPAVLVLHSIWGDKYEKKDFTQLYLTISRARVKCSVLMYYKGGRKHSGKMKQMSILLEKIEPLARVIKY